MLSVEIVVAGGGVSGLLIASALASESSVLLLEQCDSVPRNKYWLTDEKAFDKNPQFQTCVDNWYDYLDFVAYDGLTTRVTGRYCLWDTEKLIGQLVGELSRCGAQVLTGHRLYSLSQTRDGILVRANTQAIRTRLLIDCMGFGSPLVGAKGIATITGYYVLHGCEVGVKGVVAPIALDNVVIDQHPTFFELFPTSKGTAHAAIILPSRQYKPDRSIKAELSFILHKSHYSEHIVCEPSAKHKSYFGIVPVGRLHEPALDRIVFFGEAGQTNPAASATGLTRMLHTYEDLAESLRQCLRKDTLRRKDLLRAIPQYMSPINRLFQERLFESLLSFDSDDFRFLVRELREYPHDMINDLIFAEFDFRGARTLRLLLEAILQRRSILARHVMKGLARFFSRGLSI